MTFNSGTATINETEDTTMASSTGNYSITDTFEGEPIDIGSADWNAKEQGTFPPDLEAGKSYPFTFHLQSGNAPEGQPFEIKEMGKDVKVKTLQVNYKLGYTLTKEDGSTQDRTLGFQRVNFYQSPKMKAAGMNSSGVELLRALGITLTNFTTDNVKEALNGADGRSTLTAVVSWELYDKDAGQRVSTRPNKKNGDQAWPRNAQGKFEQFITPPSGGPKVAGRLTVTSFKLPTT